MFKSLPVAFAVPTSALHEDRVIREARRIDLVRLVAASH